MRPTMAMLDHRNQLLAHAKTLSKHGLKHAPTRLADFNNSGGR